MSEHYLVEGYRRALDSWRSKMYETPLGSALYCYAFVTGWEQEIAELREWDDVPSDMIPGYMTIMSMQNGQDTHQQAQNQAYIDGRAAGYAAKEENDRQH